jgi:preprotein translocase subunit YajC
VGLFKGMTERRVDSKIPIYLNPITYDLQKAMDHTSTYIGLESPLRNASRLLYAKDFKNSVQTKLGNDYWRFVEKGLKDIAGQRENYGMLENTALSLRNRLATATLGLNPFPILLQPVSIIRYSQYVKMRYLMAGITDSIMHPKVVSQTHRLWSPEFVARTGKGFSREVADVIKQGSFGQAFGQGEKIRSKLMKGLQTGDAMAVVAGMEGAVRQTLDEFRAGKLSPEVKKTLQIENAAIAGLSPEQKMSYAYKFADYVTERTQAMGLPEFQSTMQRGSAFQKMFTLFGSEASASMNMRRRAYFEAKKAGTPQAWAKYAKVLTLTLILEPMFIVVRDRLRTAAKGDKQEDIGKDIAEQLLNAPFEGLPVVRDLMRTAVRKAFDKPTGSGSILPLQRIADVATKAIVGMSDIATAKSRYARKKAALKTADATAEFVSLWTGMPYRPVMNLGEMGLRAVKELTK